MSTVSQAYMFNLLNLILMRMTTGVTSVVFGIMSLLWGVVLLVAFVAGEPTNE